MATAATGQIAALTRSDGYASPERSKVLQQIKNGDQSQQIRKAASEFVGVFIGQMFSLMNETVIKGDLGHGGKGEEMFQGMLNDEYARKIAQKDHFGLTAMITKSLDRKMHKQVAPTAATGATSQTTQPAAATTDSQDLPVSAVRDAANRLSSSALATRAYAQAGQQ